MTFCDSAARLAALVGRVTGWPPNVFWEATPSEVMLALGVEPAAGAEGPSRSAMEALISRFPDERNVDGRG